MDPRLQTILDKILHEKNLTESEKELYLRSLKEIDKSQNQLQFKLERFEKDRHTLTVMLEESIEDLQKKSKTIEDANAALQNKNRELEIESSLERVRSAAMAMKEPADMVEICRIISEQLELLNVKEIRNVQTAIFYESKGTYFNFEYYSFHKKSLVTEVEFVDHPMTIKFAKQMLAGSGKFFIRNLEGQDLKDWYEFQKTTNQFLDTHLEVATSLNYYWYSLGPIALGISTYVPLNEGEQNLFKRFRNVFELAYRRYLDIEKAEAQAREAQIQLALERVRARTMAMQKSEELTEVAALLFKQVNDLGIKTWTTGFNVWSEDNNSYVDYVTNPKGEFIKPYLVQTNASRMGTEVGQARKSGDEFFVQYAEGEKLRENYLALTSAATLQFEKILESGFQFPSHQYNHFVFGTKASLLFITYDPIPEAHDIFKRLGKVFEQTYTRFLDLQKAEEQAKEAQIEAALERVRSRTMAMHKSEDLSPVTAELFKELSKFGGKIGTSGFVLCNRNKAEDEYWVCWETGIQPPMLIPHTTDPVCINLHRGWEEGKEFYAEEKSGEELKAHFDYMLTVSSTRPVFENWLRMEGSFPTWQRWHAAYFKYGFVFVITPQPYPEEQIFKRFAPVFGQAYTRFLDLQKAEAQARESQIEVSLERVRSRSMAMHQSDELKEAGELLWKELAKLGIESLSSGYVLMDKDKKIGWNYAPNPATGKIVEPLGVLHTETKEMQTVLSYWKRQEPLSVIEMDEQETIAHQTFIAKQSLQPDGTISDWITAEQLIALSPKKLFLHNFNFKQGYLLIVGANRLGDKQVDIMLRFTKVFQQTYTRFLDLQKAEAQAREAQIEAALERVRSRTMAMHKSSELLETAELLFDQLKQLGAELQGVAFAICDKDSDMVQKWTSIGVFSVPYTIEPGEQRMYEAWENQVGIYEEVYEGERIKKYYELFMEVPAFKQGLQKFIESGHPIPTWQKNHAVTFKHGYLLLITLKPFNETEIFLRFGKVFEQTYTRFLDLQKAEAQAREAQIEAALERVRSKTMAMHNSNDVGETVATMFAEFVHLGIHTNRCGILIYNDEYTAEVWTARSTPEGKAKLIVGKLDLDAHKLLRSGYNAWTAKQSFHQYDLLDDDLTRYYTAINNSKFYPTQFDLNALPSKEFHSDFFFTDGALFSFTNEPVAEEHARIMKRFAGVFGQTYRRFLDLQKAEAQGRESQIQLALERIRARTMAMQHSNELAETVSVLFKQLLGLGIKQTQIRTCAIVTFFSEEPIGECWITKPDGEIIPNSFLVPYNKIPTYKAIYDAWKQGEKFLVLHLAGDSLIQHQNFLKKFTKIPIQEFKGFPDQSNETYTHALFFSRGYLLVVSGEPLVEYHDIFKRVGDTFQQTYTRFLDLQKAEAQAREAQIEAALERVRTKTMAMHNSQDVGDTVITLLDEFVKLGIETFRCGIGIIHPTREMEVWTAKPNASGKAEWFSGRLDMTIHPLLQGAYSKWETKAESYNYELKGDDLIDYFTSINNLPNYALKYNIASLPPRLIHSEFYFPEGALFTFSRESLSAEASQIFKRFAGVFRQTYRRYLDLQQAEAQAREALIEAALEKVRSRSLAMHHSDELEQVAASLFDRLSELGLSFDGACIYLFDKEKRNIQLWVASNHVSAPVRINLPHDEEIKDNEINKDLWSAIEKGEHIFNRSYSGKTKNDYFHYVAKYNESKIPEAVRNFQIESNSWTLYLVAEKNSLIGFDYWSGQIKADEYFPILIRFAKVFEQAYTRFLDLQKAEAQAREATVEAALERVRSKAMLMQKSEDLLGICQILFEELYKLGLNDLRNTMINIYDDDKESFLNYDFSWDHKTRVVTIPYGSHPVITSFIKQAKAKSDALTEISVTGKELESWKEFRKKGGQLDDNKLNSTKALYYYFYSIDTGAVGISNFKTISQEELELLKRFRNVFELCYRKYIDVVQAEAQAREATIEAALERVRSKAMSMYNSADLSATADVVFAELEKLGIKPIRSGVGLISKEDRKMQLYSVASRADSNNLSLMGEITLSGHPVFDRQYECWLRKENYFTSLKGAELRSYYKILSSQLNTELNIDSKSDEEQFAYWFMFSEGFFYTWSEKKYSEAEINILDRFKNVIELTFRRYIDLKKSEANAKEAVKQAALDRIRADIASMRTIKDLDRITPLVWNELMVLGIPFIRCGVFIMDDAQKQIHTFLSTPDGKAIGAFHLPYDTPGGFADVISHWRQKKIYLDHWSKEEFINLADTLVRQGAVSTREQYLTMLPDDGIHLHFLPFLQGMLYVGNTKALHEDEIELLQSVADAFSTAYARYEDFNKLEAAKQQVEKTLSDLKQTQQQLVQAEKMASLGELTAGIAHEIQNPLNFVNNFSEVSNELIEELNAERLKPNDERDEKLERELLEDIKQNLEKINHHGKRADAIVKGMLQHSRTSAGQKEATDINALADEYLRLAFHGLRAKDKTFNTSIKTDFDNSIGLISVVPQDMGRVLLNLYNNAFYAVAEKKNAPQPPGGGVNYEPLVKVSTKSIKPPLGGLGVEIRVSDNGNGIPQKLLDKIFQPFFTTKPAGQGTGLGLSLCYDIIKAHGGEIKVETKEEEGTMFVVQLPV